MIRPPPRSTLSPTTPFSPSSRVHFAAASPPLPALGPWQATDRVAARWRRGLADATLQANDEGGTMRGDRKSTRLNSSHANISYAVFCLKKKNNKCNKNTLAL